MSGVRHVMITGPDAGMRLDRWFMKQFPHVGHGHLSRLLRTGQVRLDGKRCKAGIRLAPGQVLRLPPLPEAPPVAGKAEWIPDDHDLELIRGRVIHMDDSVLVIDKPSGLAVQGGTGLARHLDAMLDGLRFDSRERPRLVHRLDRDTSGVLILARNAHAARALQKYFRNNEVEKIYWALVAGVPELPRNGRLAMPLAKKGGSGNERVEIAHEDGRHAVTMARVVETAGKTAAWLELRPLTGRTHQLRAHCAAIGHPILGDGKYGGRKAFPHQRVISRRLHLHAKALRLPHPGAGTLDVNTSLPEDLQASWDLLGFSASRG